MAVFHPQAISTIYSVSKMVNESFTVTILSDSVGRSTTVNSGDVGYQCRWSNR